MDEKQEGSCESFGILYVVGSTSPACSCYYKGETRNAPHLATTDQFL